MKLKEPTSHRFRKLSDIYPFSWEIDDYIVKNVRQIVEGNLRYADPNDPVCCEDAQSALDDIIYDLTSLRKEVRLHQSFECAGL